MKPGFYFEDFLNTTRSASKLNIFHAKMKSSTIAAMKVSLNAFDKTVDAIYKICGRTFGYNTCLIEITECSDIFQVKGYKPELESFLQYLSIW